MKMIRLFFALLMLGIFPQAFAGESVDTQIQVIQLYRPLPVETIGRQAFSSTVMVDRWMNVTPNAQIISYEPIISNDALTGWKVYWSASKKRTPVFLAYVRSEAPFVLPEGMSTEDVLKETWRVTARKLDRDRAEPVAINTKKTGDRTVVHGLWYRFSDSRWFVQELGPGKFTVGFKDSTRSAEEFRSRVSQMHKVTLPLPKSIASRPDLILDWRAPIVTEGEALVMKPFIVDEIKTWMEIKNERDGDGNLVGLRVVSVKADKPYADAGMKAGMVILGAVFTELGDLVFNVRDGPSIRHIMVKAEIIQPYMKRRSDVRIASAP